MNDGDHGFTKNARSCNEAEESHSATQRSARNVRNLYQHNCTAKVTGTAQVVTRFAHIMLGSLHRQSRAEEYTSSVNHTQRIGLYISAVNIRALCCKASFRGWLFRQMIMRLQHTAQKQSTELGTETEESHGCAAHVARCDRNPYQINALHDGIWASPTAQNQIMPWSLRRCAERFLKVCPVTYQNPQRQAQDEQLAQH